MPVEALKGGGASGTAEHWQLDARLGHSPLSECTIEHRKDLGDRGPPDVPDAVGVQQWHTQGVSALWTSKGGQQANEHIPGPLSHMEGEFPIGEALDDNGIIGVLNTSNSQLCSLGLDQQLHGLLAPLADTLGQLRLECCTRDVTVVEPRAICGMKCQASM